MKIHLSLIVSFRDQLYLYLSYGKPACDLGLSWPLGYYVCMHHL